MRDGIRKDSLVTEEIAESSDLGATPFEFESDTFARFRLHCAPQFVS
jgi:hypothetical protein